MRTEKAGTVSYDIIGGGKGIKNYLHGGEATAADHVEVPQEMISGLNHPG